MRMLLNASGREFLKSRSPVFFAGNINKPLLIGQGANDPRVNKNESGTVENLLNFLSVISKLKLRKAYNTVSTAATYVLPTKDTVI